MNLLKVMLSAGPLKSLTAKILSNQLYLHTGYHADININDIQFEENDGKTKLHINADILANSNELYKLLDSLAK